MIKSHRPELCGEILNVCRTIARSRQNTGEVLTEVLSAACAAVGAEHAVLLNTLESRVHVAFATEPTLLGMHSSQVLNAPKALLDLNWAVQKRICVGSRSWLLAFGKQEGFRTGSLDRAFSDAIESLLDIMHMRETASIDELTGLPTRAATLTQLDQTVAAARRTREQAAVLYLDLDRFKPINDSFGHGKGDQVLRTVSESMRAFLRTDEFIGRVGGDEFVVIVPRTNGIEDAVRVAERMGVAVSSAARRAGVQLSVSAGIAVYNNHAMSAETWLTNADSALYEAKRSHEPYRFYT